MLQGEGITKLVRLLEQRRAYLYHACQLVDFQSYLNLGGIPSRAYLESMEQCYTVFDTDPSERTPSYKNELVDILASEMPSLPDLSQNSNLSPELRDWAKRVIDRGIEYQFKRFAKYLRNGTLLPIL